MSTIQQMLVKEASELREAHAQLEWRQVKRAATELLVNQGIPADVAYGILNELEAKATEGDKL